MVDVRVLWAEADAPPSTDEVLTDPERTRLRALERPADQVAFRSTHVLARVLVGRVMEVNPATVRLVQRCARCGGPHGPPVARVPGRPTPRVSLSRAGGVVMAAAASAAIGVDHEPRGSGHTTVARVALTSRERAHLGRFPIAAQADALLRWWVRKEAVLKMTGHGLLVDPTHLEVSAPGAPPRLLTWDGPGPRPPVELADLELDGFLATVAVRTRGPLAVHLEHVALSDQTW